MSHSGPPFLDPALDRLLSETFLRLRQGRMAEAKERLARAKELAPDHPAVIELEGDIVFAQHRYSAAEKLYKQALELNPTSTKLEEKFATTVLKMYEPQLRMRQVPDDSLWSNRVPRKPVVSILQSVLLPGLGQLYNGDLLKGMLVMGVTILCSFAQLRVIVDKVYALKQIGATASFGDVIGVIGQGPQLIATFLLIALWIYAIFDAGVVAKNSK